jgi:glutathione synthase/RimK-type ligase-like ATP-grasp enzyme
VPLLSAYIPDATHHRVIVVGETAVAAYENPVREGDFRSVPSDDPHVYTAQVPPSLASVAVAATRAERLAFAGVDLLVHTSGRVYVLEVNYPCYFPQATLGGDIDVAGPMLDHLIARAGHLAERGRSHD